MTHIRRENGNIFVEVVSCDKEIEQSIAYNFKRKILGHGDDLIEWNILGDLWGYFNKKHRERNHRYSLRFAEIQFTKDEVREIMRSE